MVCRPCALQSHDRSVARTRKMKKKSRSRRYKNTTPSALRGGHLCSTPSHHITAKSQPDGEEGHHLHILRPTSYPQKAVAKMGVTPTSGAETPR